MKLGMGLFVAVLLMGIALAPVQAAAPEGMVIFHDAFRTYDDIQPGGPVHVGMYQQDVTPWMDVLVQLEDGKWYGPERNGDDISAEPLPEGYRWEFANGFSGTPAGEMWWNASAPEGEAKLFDPSGNVVVVVPLRIELHIPGTSDGAPLRMY